MANDKKFIVKNGLLTSENVVIGDTLDRSTGRLQVKHDSGSDAARFDGRVVFDHDTISQAAIDVTNDGGTNAIIASFNGSSGGDLRLTSIGAGDYFLFQSNQNNGIKFFDGNDGLQFIYSNSVKFEIDSGGADFKIGPTVNGEAIWYEGNDGSGSGLDADLLDGLDSLQFLRSDEDDTMNGSLTITGDLTVNGNTTYVNTEQLLVSDNIFTLNADYTSGTPTENAGMEVRRGDEANSSIIWDESNDWWKLISADTDLGRIITTADEGSGNGFDADTVDGLEGYQFLRSDVDDTANGHITFEADITVGDGSTNARINFQTAGQDRVLYANNGEIGFLNAGLNYAAKSDASDNWVVTNNVVAKQFVDADNNSYLVDPASTSVLNNIDLEGNLRHNGDTDTYLTFGAGNTLNVYTGGNERLRVNDSNTTAFSDMVADRFVDRQNSAYYANPASSSVFNTLGLDSDLFHNGDTNTKLSFGNDVISLQTNGSERLRIDNTGVRSSVNVYAPIYYDSNNNSYYGDFNSTSVMNSINIDDYIRHNGDTTTYFGFPATDVFRIYTNNIQRFNVDNNSADFAVNVYAPRYYDSNNTSYYVDPAGDSQMNTIDIDDYIRHRGDLNTYFGFNAADQIRFVTGGGNRLTIDTDSADFNVNVYAPRYYDSNNATYYGDFATTSVMNTIDLEGQIRHNGDTDTYMQFPAANTIEFWTGGSRALQLTNTAVTIGSLRKLIIPDYIEHAGDTNTYFGFDGNDSITFQTDGSEKLGIDSNSIETTVNFGVNKVPTAALSVQPTGTMGNNPFASGNILADFGDAGTVDFSIRGTASAREAWFVSDANSDFVFSDNGATIALGINTGTNTVVIGDQSPTYTDGGDNTALTTTPSNAKLHVNGSIYLNGNNDGIIFGRGTASFLKDEELAFGWGGGLYMTDATYLRIRNNKAVYSTGDYYGARFYAQANNAYYLDPDSTSVLNRIGINDRIFHNGDTDTYMEFDAADNFRIVTGNGERLDINNSRVLANNAMHSPIFYDSNNTAYYGDFNNTSQMSRIDIDDYIRHRGDTNTYIGFDTNDKFRVVTAGGERLAVRASDVRVRNKLYVYGTQADNGDAVLIQSNANGDGVTIRMSDQNSGENVTPSQSGTIGFYHVDNAVSPGGNAAFYFRTTEPISHFVFGSESNGGGSSAANYPAIVPDVNGVGYLGLSNRRWQNLNVITGNFSGNVTAVDMYANRYYDANNNSYYGDFASTSIMNTVRVNRLEVDTSGRYIDSPSGQYGTIRVQGTVGGWAGYAINDDWVFMANGATNMGLYNDTRNEWSLYAQDNNFTRLYANGVHQIGAENGYGYAPNQMRAPIYYDSSNTGYYVDPNASNTNRSARFSGRIYRDGFQTSGDGNNNKLLEAQDYTHWIWNTATDWGIMWAGNNNPYRSYFSTSNPNEIVFIGNGSLRASIDLDNGRAHFTGEVTAPNFAINGGNENLSINKAYTRGAADETIFDGSSYFEKRVTRALQGNESGVTTNTSEYVKSSNAPGGSSYVLRTSGYRTFYSDYIEVEPGEELFGEIHARRVSGSGGVLYYGIERFDKDKRPIAGNTGTTYFVASNVNVSSTGWTTYRGHTTIPTSHTVYNGSDGGGVRYVRLRILYNYNSGGALREFTMPILKRTNYHSRIRTDYEIYGSRYYDSNNNSYYLDPASTSKLNTVDASNFRDRDNTAYYMNPATGGKVRGSWDWTNGSIENLNNLSFNDPGPQEGVRWKGGNEWKIYESPNDLSTNSGGNLQFTSGSGAGTMRMRIETDGDVHIGRYFYASRFYDNNNNSYYVDPASTSIMNTITVDRVNMKDRGDYITFYGNDSVDHSITSRNETGGISDDLRFNSYDNFFFNADSNNNNGNGSGIYLGQHGGGSGTIQNRWAFQARNDGITQASGSLRAPIFYDSNDTGYYVNPNGTSRMEKIRFEGTDEAIELNSSNPYIRWMENGTDRFYIQWRGSYDAPLFRNQQGDHFDFMPDSSSGAVSLRLKGSDDDIWGYVYAADDQDIGFLDDQGNWAIRHNRDSWTYFYINNSLRAYVDNGSFQHVSSIRSPIFYDRNNTSYYGDFASNSRMNQVTLNTLSWNDGYDMYDTDGDTIYLRSNNNDHGELIFADSDSYACGRIYWDDDNHWGFRTGQENEWSIYMERNARTILYYNGGQQARTQNGYFEANNQLRTPIFYDSNDTGFYANPNGTSRFRNLTVLGVINTPGVTGYANRLLRKDNRSIEPNDDPAGQLTFGFTSWNNNNTSPYADYLHLRSYTDSSGGSDNLLMFKKSGRGMRLWQQSFNSGSPYSSFSEFVLYNANPGSGNNLYASIYYDADNTSYYANPNGTSQFYHLQLNNQLRMESGAPIYFYTSSNNLRGYIRATESNDSHFEFATSGGEDFIFRDGGFGGSWNQIIRGNGHVLTANRHDSPIYYDRNNTFYYGDFASTNRFNTTQNYGKVYFYARQNDSGGSYNYAPSGRVREYLNNTTAEFHSGNDQPITLYFRSGVNAPSDFGYITFDPDYNNSGENAAMVIGVENDGTGSSDYIRLQGRTWVDSDLISSDNTEIMRWLYRGSTYGIINTDYLYHSSDVRSPLFYDSNNTSYYVDPASTSRLNNVRANYFTNDGSVASNDNFGLYWDSGRSTAYAIYREAGSWTYRYPDLRIAFHTGIKFGANGGYNGMRFYDDYTMSYLVMSVNDDQTSGRRNVYVRNRFDAGSQIRTPIIYDRNNSGYYWNGDGTSRMYQIRVPYRIHIGDESNLYNAVLQETRRPEVTIKGQYPQFNIMSSEINNGTHGPTIRWVAYDSANASSGNFKHWVAGIAGTNATRFSIGYSPNNTNPHYGIGRWSSGNNNAIMWIETNRHVYFENFIYATRFYDRNNTGYYVDPSDFSNLNTGVRANEFYARNWFRNDNSGEGLYNQSTGQHWYSDNDDGWNVAGGGGANWVRMRDQYAGTIRGYFYADSSNNVGILNNGGGWRMRIVNADWGLFDGSSVRAQIFYDSNNTTYRFNGSSRYDTNFDGLNNRAKATMGLTGQTRSSAQDYGHRPRFTGDGNYWTGVYGWGRVDMNSVANWGSGFFDTWSNPANQPGGTSHWVGVQSYHYTNGGSRYGWQIAGGPISNLRFRNTWGGFSSWKTIPILGANSGNGAAMYASIYYDSNNTGYYCDPSSFSNFNSGVRANEFYARNWFRNDNSGEGLYNQATGQHFYSDNDDYWNVAGGGSANAIRMRDQYAGSIRGYFYADSSRNVGILNNGGSWRIRVVNADYTLIYGSSIRAQIFYDSNNTAYYFNGASGHSTRFEGVNNRTMAWLGKPGHTRDSGEYYRARPRITGDTNYWTGAYGWGRLDMTNSVADWGSGFIDSWSNPANQPSGTSHWVGVQSYHYSNGSSRYGWQMVGGPITNLRFRSTWGGFRSWRTIPVLDENNGNGGYMYAGRYYDSNNTGYYLDPASYSRLNYINANHYALNDGWDIYDDDNDTLNIRSGNSDHGEMRFRDSGTYCGRIYWDDDGSIMSMYHDNGEAILYADQDYITYIYYNGTWEGRTRSGYFEARGSFRAPLFYDQNNTFYYTNPASTSRMNAIQCYGVIQSDEDIRAYVNYSDIRWKKNVKRIENPLEKLMTLDGITYNYIDKEGEYTGVVAQQVEKVLPGVVVDAEDMKTGKERKSVRYGNMVGLLIEATKEQQGQIEQQQETINKQQEQLNNQQETIDRLEEMVKMLIGKIDNK